MEEIYDAWLGSADAAEQESLERAYELEGLQALPFLPLGRYRQTSAWRTNLRGLLEGPSVVFWNITKG
jgi:peptide/nickel transport system substrate-binding protein